MKTMRVICLMFLSVLISVQAFSQKIYPTTPYPTMSEPVTVRFDISQCSNKALLNYSGDVYVHTGVNQWENVIAGWSENIAKAKCTKVSANLYEISITPTIKDYYGLSADYDLTRLCFVLRSSDGTKQTEDLFLDTYKAGLNVSFLNPTTNTVAVEGASLDVSAEAVGIGTTPIDSVLLYIDENLVHTSKYDTISTIITAPTVGNHILKVVAINSEFVVADSLNLYVSSAINVAELPAGVKQGINYIDDNTVTLVLFAPKKKAIYAIGDFNDWTVDNDYLMNRTSNDSIWWITLNGLNAGEEYAYQYFIDGNIRVADPYTEKVLDPWNDNSIPSSTYPDLKPYPTGKTTNIVSVLQTAQPAYSWPETDFTEPASTDLVIYEIHVKNFTDAGIIRTVSDTLDYLQQLGVNAIELMPVNEFESNNSWGYNPSFYFAFDKAYGTKNDFKDFVAECHSRGIAVIIDMVLNHSYSQSPMVQMYWDGSSVTADNPWYNVTCPHSNWCWGYDFNHESKATKYFVDRVTSYWINEYHVDGYRFDFTKGFTNKVDANAWGPDASRIAILERMAGAIWDVKPDAKVIFEHLAENTEEKALSNYGILLWGNMNSKYNEATMGYNESDKSNLSGTFYTNRSWTVPGLVSYMESHDEERLMYKNTQFGNSSGDYDVKNLATGLQRIETAAAFFFTIPGPKMIWEWGELGYDFCINRCTDGTISDACRLALKPIRWDYYEDSKRYRLYKVFEALIDFKESGFCNTNDFTFNVAGAQKSIHLNTATNAATIIGNFAITSATISPGFQHTGTWYDYMTGNSVEISDVNAAITLNPGEYHIYTDIQLPIPEVPTSSIKVINDGVSVELYPNPVTNRQLFLNYSIAESKDITFKIYSLTGELLMSDEYQIENEGTISVDLSKIQSQVLLYEISTNTGKYIGKLMLY